MHKNNILTLALITTLAFPLISGAAIYKHVDKDGHITYSNVKSRGGKKLNIESSSTSAGSRSAKKSTPSKFPKVDKSTQQKRDSSRKAILQSELASEQQALVAAKQAYEEGSNNPETFKNANGGISRNVAKFQEKMKRLQKSVDVHQRNINLLEKEVANLK